MENNLLSLIAIIPFLVLFLLVVFKKWPIIKSMPLTYILTILIVIIFFKISLTLIFASFIKGIFIALEIILIVFGAVLFLEILKEKGQTKNIHSLMSVISNDARIQGIIIAFLFGSLIEGIAGFGTPAALAAPLLVTLGFTPLLAVIVSLIANSAPVSFGAAGTPILIGLGSLNLTNLQLIEVTRQVSLIHAIASIIIPLAIVSLIVFQKNNKFFSKELFEMIPFIILAWLSFVIPYLLVAWLIGPELPSILGGFIGLILTSIAAHYKILVPKREFYFSKYKSKETFHPLKVIKATSPYLLIILFLFLSRAIPSLKGNITKFSLNYVNILGTNLNYTFLPFYTPSFYFIISAIFCIFLFKANKSESKKAISKSLHKVKYALISLIFTLALVQLMIVSNMPLVIAEGLKDIPKNLFLFISPLIGVFGAFIAGSNTISNLLMGSFQIQTARYLSISPTLILSLQVIGGAIGNMIAIHNIIAASATVGLKNKELTIIKKNIIIVIIYSLIVSGIAFFLSY